LREFIAPGSKRQRALYVHGTGKQKQATILIDASIFQRLPMSSLGVDQGSSCFPFSRLVCSAKTCRIAPKSTVVLLIFQLFGP
jgi:hypothetical protein